MERLKIYEVNQMDKEWYKSKTIWAAAIIALVGVLNAMGIEVPTDLVITLAGALGVYGIRDAIGKNK